MRWLDGVSGHESQSEKTLGDSKDKETFVLQSMGSQRIGHDLGTEQQKCWVDIYLQLLPFFFWIDCLIIMQCPSLSLFTVFMLKSIFSEISFITLDFF